MKHEPTQPDEHGSTHDVGVAVKYFGEKTSKSSGLRSNISLQEPNLHHTGVTTNNARRPLAPGPTPTHNTSTHALKRHTTSTHSGAMTDVAAVSGRTDDALFRRYRPPVGRGEPGLLTRESLARRPRLAVRSRPLPSSLGLMNTTSYLVLHVAARNEDTSQRKEDSNTAGATSGHAYLSGIPSFVMDSVLVCVCPLRHTPKSSRSSNALCGCMGGHTTKNTSNTKHPCHYTPHPAARVYLDPRARTCTLNNGESTTPTTLACM